MKKMFLPLFLVFVLIFSGCSASDNFSKDSSLVAITYDVLSEDAEFYSLEFQADFEKELLLFSLHGIEFDDKGEIGGELYDLAEDTFKDVYCSSFDETEHFGDDFVLSIVFKDESCSFTFAMDDERFADVLNFYTEFVNYVTSDKF